MTSRLLLLLAFVPAACSSILPTKLPDKVPPLADMDEPLEHERKRLRFVELMNAPDTAQREPLSEYLSSIDLAYNHTLDGPDRPRDRTYWRLAPDLLQEALPLIGEVQRANADYLFKLNKK